MVKLEELVVVNELEITEKFTSFLKFMEIPGLKKGTITKASVVQVKEGMFLMVHNTFGSNTRVRLLDMSTYEIAFESCGDCGRLYELRERSGVRYSVCKECANKRAEGYKKADKQESTEDADYWKLQAEIWEDAYKELVKKVHDGINLIIN